VGPFVEAVHGTFGPRLELLLKAEQAGSAAELDPAMAN
jgi:hypothetical protein